jgi:hypothetical protein
MAMAGHRRVQTIGGDMPRRILFDQLHINVYVAKWLPAGESKALSRDLNGSQFQTRLRQAVRAVFRRERSLRRLTVSLTG